MLIVLAISFTAFVSLVGYQWVSNTGHDHDLENENVSPTNISANYPGKTRTYYIAADEVRWDFAPTPGKTQDP